jgi:hypothetical protein
MQEAGAAIQNKIGQFVANPLVRNIIGQPKSTFDLRKLMDEKKILIINLSKGRVGEANANLLGSMLITKIYLGAMSRADVSPGALKKLPNFNLYVDEFQSFANESFADILSEARKYKLSLIIAHQYIEQMSDEVRAAVFGNVGSMIAFRVGAFDAEVLEKEFFPTFTKEDIVNLGIFQIYLKLMIDGVTSPPFSAATLPPIEKPIVSFKEDIIKHSRSIYANPRPQVEEAIKQWHEPIKVEPKADFKRIEKEKPALKDILTAALKKSPESEKPAEKIFEKQQVRDAQAKPPVAMQPPLQRPVQTSAERKVTQENELRKVITLNYLKNVPAPQANIPPKKNPKEPTKENMSALRNALSAVLGAASQQSEQKPVEAKITEKKIEQKSEAPKAPEQPRTEQKAEQKKEEAQKKEAPAEEKKPKEVPEEILKKILEIKS